MNKSEKKRLKFSLFLPVFFILAMWIVFLFDNSFNLHLYKYGIHPLKIKGFFGIFFAPFIHSDFDHIFSNTFPFLILATSLFFFYREYAYKVFLLMFFFSGFWVWIAARPSYHIGASGIIYALASFLFFSGVIHKNKTLSSVSLIVVFVYGSMVWGVLPYKSEVSWEGHMFGAITGIILTLAFAKKLPSIAKENDIDFFEEEEIEIFSKPTISYDYFKDVEYLYTEEDEK